MMRLYLQMSPNLWNHFYHYCRDVRQHQQNPDYRCRESASFGVAFVGEVIYE
jgi:hypothetical protein